MKNNSYFLYAFLNSVFIQWIRVLFFLLLGIIVYLSRDNMDFVVRLVPLYFVLIVQELFIFTKVNKFSPSKTVDEGSGNLLESIDFKTRVLFQKHKIAGGLKKIKNTLEVKELISFLHEDFQIEDIVSTDELLLKASEVVKKTNGRYIHALDIYASYILLLGEKTKILFEREITPEDIITIVLWIKKEHELDEEKTHTLHFSGNGVFDSLVYGWSSELSHYALNFTEESLHESLAKPIGRDREYDLLISSLSKNSSSNVILVGNPGSGKTSLIRQFALDSNASLLPSQLSRKIVFKFYAERLIAGIENPGDLEARFVLLLEELSHAGNVVVYIPNIENIFGGGGINLDLSGMLSEYLKSNKIKIIGTTTEASYQTFIYPKQELRELMDVVEIAEPDESTLVFMLLEKASEFKSSQHIQITYKGIIEAIALSSSYISDGTSLPGRAISLLEDVISHSKTHGEKVIDKEDVRSYVEEKVHVVLSKPTKDESNQLLHLEEEMHRKIVSQDEAVSAISNAMRRVRSGMKDEKRPIASFLFLGPTGVGKTETAKALAALYFGNENSMIRLDMSEYQTQESLERLLGSNNPNEYVDNIGTKVMNNPFSLILLDEFEKAHPKILDIFLSVFDEGRLTDNSGRIVSFANTIIIATSNAGSELIREKMSGRTIMESDRQELIDAILKNNIFKPELINRFDDVIVFKPLMHEDVVLIADKFMKEIANKLTEQRIILQYSKEVLEFIASASFSAEFGARNIRRFIEQAVENQISTKLLNGGLLPGGVANLSVVNNTITVNT